MTGKVPQQNAAGAQALYRSALEALSAGKFEDGIVLLEKLAATTPPNSEIHNNLGTAHWKCGRLNKAEEHYAKAVKLSPENALAQNNYGGLLLETLRLAEAEKHIRRAHQLKPNHPSIANHLGLIQCWHGDFADAEDSFRRAILLRPEWSNAHGNIGSVYRDTGRFQQAEASYRRAIQLDPGNANAWRDLGHLQFLQLRNAEAEETLRKALSLRPKSENTWSLLLQLLESLNRLDAAEAELKKAKALFPDSAPIAAIEGRLLRRAGKAAEALAEMERIAPMVVGTPAAGIAFFFELGQLYDQIRQADKAFAAFQRGNDCQAAQPEAATIDKTSYTKITARMIHDLTPELAKVFPAPVDDPRAAPVFLVGFPRSGTTLLDQILSSHPGVYVAEERAGVAMMGEYFTRKFGTSLKPGQQPRSGVEVWRDDAYPAAIPRITPDDIVKMREAFYREHHVDDKIGGRLFVDKMPVNLMHAGFIHAVFPKAKFILALRHPCDCVLSCFMQSFGMNPAMARFLDLEDGAHFYDEIFSVWERTRQVLPLQVHAIRYEDVVADFQPSVAGLLTFLDLPWNDAVLEYDKTAKSRERINTPSYHQVTQKIYTRASGRWLRYREHLKPVIGILNPHAERYGYSMEPGE